MSDSGHLTSTLINGTLVVSFQDKVSIDEVIVADVSQELFEMTATADNVVLDMGHVDFFGSSFIEAMFRTWNKTKAKGDSFAVCCLNPYCREVLEVTNLIEMWGGYESREAAIAAFPE